MNSVHGQNVSMFDGLEKGIYKYTLEYSGQTHTITMTISKDLGTVQVYRQGTNRTEGVSIESTTSAFSCWFVTCELSITESIKGGYMGRVFKIPLVYANSSESSAVETLSYFSTVYNYRDNETVRHMQYLSSEETVSVYIELSSGLLLERVLNETRNGESTQVFRISLQERGAYTTEMKEISLNFFPIIVLPLLYLRRKRS